MKARLLRPSGLLLLLAATSAHADGFADDVTISGGGCTCRGAGASPAALLALALLAGLRRRRATAAR